MNNNNTIGGAGQALIGAGIASLTNTGVGLLLIGVGVVLIITVAILQKNGIAVQSSNLG